MILMASESSREAEIELILEEPAETATTGSGHLAPKPHAVLAVLAGLALVAWVFLSSSNTVPNPSGEGGLSETTIESVGLIIYQPSSGINVVGLDGQMIDALDLLEAPTGGGIASLADRVIYVGNEQAWSLSRDGSDPTPMGPADLVMASRSTDLVWLGSFPDDTDIGHRGPSQWRLIDVEGTVHRTRTVPQLPRPFPSPGLSWFTTGMSRIAESEQQRNTYTVSTAGAERYACLADATVSRMRTSTLVACVTKDGLVVFDLDDGNSNVVLPDADPELQFVLTSLDSAG